MKRLERLLLYLLPSFGDILWVGIIVGTIGQGSRMMNIDGDLGRHLTIGTWILEQKRIPITDLFSHTMIGQSLTPHEWLAQLIFAVANKVMGLNGVVLICGLVIATSFWLIYYRARTESRSILAAVFVTILAVAISSFHWLTRPHVFTFLLLALWMIVLEQLRKGNLKRWWLLPSLMLIWANVHGAFIAGFVTWGLYGLGLAWDTFWKRFPVGKQLPVCFWRYYFLGGISAFLVTSINPVGLQLWTTSLGFISNHYLVNHTMEYLSPNFQEPGTWPFLFAIGLLVVLFGLQNKRIQTAQVLPAAAWLVMGLYSIRNVPLFAIVAAPMLAGLVGDWLSVKHPKLETPTRLYRLDQNLLTTDLRLRGVIWPIVAIVILFAGLQSGAKLDFQQHGNQFDLEVFPVRATDWLVENPQQGNMFNYFTWGGYLLYRLWPEQKVFIDGQTDFYGEQLTRQYEQLLTLAPGWQTVLSQYNIEWVILPPHEILIDVLHDQLNWNVVYQDTTAVVLTRPKK